MKINREIIAITVSFALGLVIGIAIEENISSLAFKEFGPILATLAAAFFGAHYAFALNRQKDEEKTKREHLNAGNTAIFTMALQANKLHNFQAQILDPHRNNPERLLTMRPIIVAECDMIKLDINSLTFLLEHKDHADLLGRIAIADSKYSAAIIALKQRSIIHINEAQPRLEQSSTPVRNFEEAKQALGPRICKILESSTDQAIELVDSARDNIDEMGNQLSKTLKQLFPGKPVVSFKLPESSEKTEPRI